ncbi:FkbM family methyltransferase [Halomarina oriensis]|uniref:FkbM family methyltransferase n=1 Tax=Halomarina oriensis TaxID=671145 RepID=UPI0018EF26CE
MSVSLTRRSTDRARRTGLGLYHRAASLNYAYGVATTKRTVAGPYRSYEPWNSHGDDSGLAALGTLPDDAVVVDAGAHVGEYALPLAAAGRTVHAVEPDPVAAERLRANRSATGVESRVTVHDCGLGDRDGTATFYRSSAPKGSAFDETAATRWGARVVERVDRRVARLDTLVDDLPPPDALKLDVEGAELAALRGAERTLREHRPLVVVEPHGTDRELRAELVAFGYAVDPYGDCWVCRP